MAVQSIGMYFGVGLLLISLFHGTDGCSCLASHPQQQFCDAAYVIRAIADRRTEVIPEPTDPPTFPPPLKQIMYTVITVESFKGPFFKDKKVDIFTASNSAACGVNLNTTERLEYLLAGSFINGQYRISLCDWVSRWTDVNDCIKANLGSSDVSYTRSTYNCDCKVTQCTGGDKKKCRKNRNGCNFKTGETEQLNGICTRPRKYYGRGKCTWRECRYG